MTSSYLFRQVRCVMKQTFGSFIKEKRIQNMIKLNSFAKLIGISPVYLSYLENGKRPAPSDRVLKAIIEKLNLNEAESDVLLLLAAETHHHSAIPSDLIDYINNTKYVTEALRIAKEHNVSDFVWQDFIDRVKSEYF